MKRFTVLLVALMLSFVLLSAATVSGTVVKQTDNESLAYVNVVLMPQDDDRHPGHWNSYRTVTDENGEFVFDDVEIGTYVAQAHDWNFEIEFYQEAATEEEATPIVVASEDTTIIDINFTLESWLEEGDGVISGTVMNADEEVVMGWVHAIPADEEDEDDDRCPDSENPGQGGHGGMWMNWAEIEEDGSYSITGLVYGEYVVKVMPGFGYNHQYYDGVEEFEDATVITLTEETPEIAEINFVVTSWFEEGDGVISGTVMNADEEVVMGWVHAIPADEDDDDDEEDEWNPGQGGQGGHGGMWMNWAEIEEDGSYSITGLAMDEYVVKVMPAFGYNHQYYDGVEEFEDATVITLTEETPEVAEINFVVTSWFEEGDGVISGMISAQGEFPVMGWVHAIPADNEDEDDDDRCPDSENPGHGGHGGMWMNWAEIEEDGSYSITGLVYGEYVVKVMPGFGYNHQYYDGVEEFEDATVITLTEETPEVTDINFALQAWWQEGSAVISGTISDIDGTPIADAFVRLYQAEEDDDDRCPDWHRPHFAYTDSLGQYVFENIIAGDYVVGAEAWGYYSRFYEDAEEIEMAQVLTIADSSVTENINITLPAFELYTVTGTVRDANNQPLADAFVSTSHRCEDQEDRDPGNGGHHGGNHWWTTPFAFTDENGEFVLELPAGEYVFSAFKEGFNAQYYDHKESAFDADIVELEADIEGIDFDLTVFADTNSISGTILDNGEVADYPIFVAAVSTEADWEEGNVEYHYGMVDFETGEYTIYGLANAEYYVFAEAPGGQAPRTFYPQALTWEEATAVTANGDVEDVNITVNSVQPEGILSLNGMIRDAQGNPVANTTVAILNNADQVVAFATTGIDGSYEIYNLLGGNLEVVATKINYHSEVTAMELAANAQVNFVLNPVPETTAAPSVGAQVRTQTELTNFPNPFNPETVLQYSVPQAAHVELSIFNVKGQLVRTLVNDQQEAGTHQILWNGRNAQGEESASGVYFYMLKMNSKVVNTRSMVLMK